MPKLTLWMMSYGVLLLVSDFVDSSLFEGQLGLNRTGHLCGWTGGAVMIVSGLATAAGRRSIRLSGISLGTILPVLVGLLLAWRSGKLWQAVRTGSTDESLRLAVAVTCLALASLGACWAIVQVRPREGIASRGYAVTTPIPRQPAQGEPSGVAEPPRRSEAG
jgi:hypothetical protein